MAKILKNAFGAFKKQLLDTLDIDESEDFFSENSKELDISKKEMPLENKKSPQGGKNSGFEKNLSNLIPSKEEDFSEDMSGMSLPKKEEKRGKSKLLKMLSFPSLKDVKPMEAQSSQIRKTEDTKDILNALGIDETPDLRKIPMTLKEIKGYSFTLIAKPLTGLDPNEVSRFCDRVEQTIYQYDRVIEKREKDIKKLAKEVAKLQNDINNSLYDTELQHYDGGLESSLQELQIENRELKDRILELQRLIPPEEISSGVEDENNDMPEDLTSFSLNFDDYAAEKEMDQLSDMKEDSVKSKEKILPEKSFRTSKPRSVFRNNGNKDKVALPELPLNRPEMKEKPFDQVFNKESFS